MPVPIVAVFDSNLPLFNTLAGPKTPHYFCLGCDPPWFALRNLPEARIRIIPQLWKFAKPTIVTLLMNLESGVDATGGQLLSCGRKQGTQTPSFLQQIYQCICVSALALASYFIISHFILQSVQVVGVSMVPTLHDSQQYLLNRWVYYFRAPRRSDVVVLRDPVDKGFAVKRVIATAGDRVYLKDGKVFINGCKLNEPYLASGMPTFPYLAENEQSIILGKDQFFVLGDNRKNSADSRTYGPVPRRSILGLIVR